MPTIPKSKPKNYSKILDALNTPQAAKTFSPETYVNLVGEYSRKAYDNGELSKKEYMNIVQPLFGDTGIMATEKIKKYEDELNKYADGGRIGFLEGGTKYNAMVTEMYIKAGGQKGTGMDIDSFAQKYFPKMAQGGRIGFDQGSMDPDTMALKEKIEEIMDIEGVDFGTAFKQAMRELASQSRENNSEGTMPKSERWMRDYFFSGKGGYDDRMTYKEFALGPGQELYKRFSKD